MTYLNEVLNTEPKQPVRDLEQQLLCKQTEQLLTSPTEFYFWPFFLSQFQSYII